MHPVLIKTTHGVPSPVSFLALRPCVSRPCRRGAAISPASCPYSSGAASASAARNADESPKSVHAAMLQPVLPSSSRELRLVVRQRHQQRPVPAEIALRALSRVLRGVRRQEQQPRPARLSPRRPWPSRPASMLAGPAHQAEIIKSSVRRCVSSRRPASLSITSSGILTSSARSSARVFTAFLKQSGVRAHVGAPARQLAARVEGDLALRRAHNAQQLPLRLHLAAAKALPHGVFSSARRRCLLQIAGLRPRRRT